MIILQDSTDLIPPLFIVLPGVSLHFNITGLYILRLFISELYSLHGSTIIIIIIA